MVGKKISEPRRKLLKTVVTGSGVIVAGKNIPQTWSRPVIDAVLLPSHAQTSGRTYAGNNLLAGLSDQENETLLAGWINNIFPVAIAQPQISVNILDACAKPMGDKLDFSMQFIDVINEGNGGLFTGIIPKNGTGEVKVINFCNPENINTLAVLVTSDEEKMTIIGLQPNATLVTIPLVVGCVEFTPLPDDFCIE